MVPLRVVCGLPQFLISFNKAVKFLYFKRKSTSHGLIRKFFRAALGKINNYYKSDHDQGVIGKLNWGPEGLRRVSSPLLRGE